jgi:hypothetical protein
LYMHPSSEFLPFNREKLNLHLVPLQDAACPRHLDHQSQRDID